MKIQIEVTEEDIKKLIIEELSKKLDLSLTEDMLVFEVKSTHNYIAEWEVGKFRVTAVRSNI